MTIFLSFHVEQCNGLNHLAWCVWKRNQYSQCPDGFSLLNADKVSQSEAILPKLIETIEKEKPNAVIYLKECPRAKALSREMNCIHCPRKGLKEWGMDETLLAHSKDLISQDLFNIPENLLFQPDLIFDEGFEGCILQGDAIHHDDTTLLLSKACAIGATYIACGARRGFKR